MNEVDRVVKSVKGLLDIYLFIFFWSIYILEFSKLKTNLLLKNESKKLHFLHQSCYNPGFDIFLVSLEKLIGKV